MADTNDIREMFFSEGKNKTEISKETGFDRKTVSKYILQDDWNEPVENNNQRESKLDPYKEEIYSWIKNDQTQRVKQRHTAFRVFIRLKDKYKEEFDCCYKTVANYVAIIKKEVYSKSKGSLPLDHNPGEAQVDFGSADFIENGTRYSGKFLALSFPYSNTGYYQFFYGETYECLAQGMQNIFEYLGGVPHRIWFDNASSMVAAFEQDGKRKLTDSFIRFKNHYGFEAVFCNRAKGNEKGHVEGKVGFYRRNFMVPIPEFNDIQEYNKTTFMLSESNFDELHYKKKVKISNLFKEDKSNLLELPSTGFEVVSYTTSRVDNYGKIKLNSGKHVYSVVPKEAGNNLMVAKSAFYISVFDENLREIVKHKRFYGETYQESMDWIPYLDQISKYPTAFKYTGIHRMLPDPVNEYLDRLNKKEKGQALKVLSKITQETDFNTGVDIFSKALKYNVNDSDSLISIYYRNSSNFPEMEAIPLSSDIPELEPITIDTKSYDLFLNEGSNSEY